jgi:hypothetical protein
MIVYTKYLTLPRPVSLHQMALNRDTLRLATRFYRLQNLKS